MRFIGSFSARSNRSAPSRAGWRTAGAALAGVLGLVLALAAGFPLAHAWSEEEFARRPLFAYPLPHGRNNIIGNLIAYQVQKGDTLLDIGRWFGCTAKEISDANHHLDWWLPPVDKKIILPGEHVLPSGPHAGIVLNIPEMRLYYYYPSPTGSSGGRRKEKSAGVTPTAFSSPASPAASGASRPRTRSGASVTPEVVYTFPVGLGRFDWKTPVGAFTVTARRKDPAWVAPDDIYKEHLETDGEAEHVIPGGDPDNPLGHYKLDLSIPEYGIHGTNVPWGVGMEVSHGCIRLYPEDIEHLFHKVKAGVTGRIVYQPIKFGWRGDALYVEVHDDLYGKYPGLWNLAMRLVKANGLEDRVDLKKLEQAVEDKTGVPTYVMPGSLPDDSGAAGS